MGGHAGARSTGWLARASRRVSQFPRRTPQCGDHCLQCVGEVLVKAAPEHRVPVGLLCAGPGEGHPEREHEVAGLVPTYLVDNRLQIGVVELMEHNSSLRLVV